MNILLFLPSLLVLLVKSSGIFTTIYHLGVILAVQIAVAMQFLQYDPQAYVANAFELSRVFLYKWTVNWRFVPEDVFLTKQFALGLLGIHGITLLTFGVGRWCGPDGIIRVLKRALAAPALPAGLVPVTSDGKFSRFSPDSSFHAVSPLRIRDSDVHVQPDRNPIRKIATLPVLLMVCPTVATADVSNKVPYHAQVSSSISSCLPFADLILLDSCCCWQSSMHGTSIRQLSSHLSFYFCQIPLFCWGYGLDILWGVHSTFRK
jgi:hypothetical protein